MGKKICVVGTGYVGLVTAIGLAEFGNTVTAVDTDTDKIDQLNAGKSPIYEPDLEGYLKKYTTDSTADDPAADRLRFSSDVSAALANSDVIFIAVGTPMDKEGRADLRYVNQVVNEIARNFAVYKLVVIKSTVPVGTNAYIRKQLAEKTGRKSGEDFDIVSNPEFLREGRALEDVFQPDRIVIGYETRRARDIMADIYRDLLDKEVPFQWCRLESAELIKYASNAFLATKIAFINEIANLADSVGADINEISHAIGLDSRIGTQYLIPGPGYGGSCFPKDTRALTRIASDYNTRLSIVDTVIESNERQKEHMVEKLLALFGTSLVQKQALQGRNVAVLGLAFKKETDDVRESPAIVIVKELKLHGAVVRAYDPQAMANFKRMFPDIHYGSDMYATAENADALLVLTEWDEFRGLDLSRLKGAMRGNAILDTRNILDPAQAHKEGFRYRGVGRSFD